MIASENYASAAVLEATGSVFTNKYAEGYPGKRYYAGNQFSDELENLAIDRAKRLFRVEHANVQPTSGAEANMAKLAASQAGVNAVDASLQCFGGNGFTQEYGIFDLYPLVRLTKTAPVNNEMILNYIAEHVLGLPRSY